MKLFLFLLCIFFGLTFSIFAQPNFDLVGFATLNGGTNGGAGGSTVSVTNYADLKKYAESSDKYIIMVNGTITNGTAGAKINIKSNKSIIGVGSTAFLNGVGLEISTGNNVIIQNIKITFVGLSNPSGVNGGDLISIHTSAKNIWIDHCELYAEDPNVQTNIDKYDGMIDIKGQTGFVTISWCYLHDHHKACLIGASETDLYNDRKVTFHHNYFNNVKLRLPMYRGATGHFLNNYLKDAKDASEIRNGACVRIEKNYYENFNYAIYTPNDYKGTTERIDNYLSKTQSRAFPANCTADIPYNYSTVLTSNVADVKSLVSQWAGVGKLNSTPTTQTPTVTTPVAYCQGTIATALTANGTALKWYTSATGGTSTTIAPVPSTSVAGSTSYYVSQTLNNIESARVAIVVNVTSTPVAPTVSTPVTYTQNTTATALTAIGTALKWYTVANGGTATMIAPTPTTTSLGTINYYVSQTVNSCESNRANISVIVSNLKVTLKLGWNLIGCPITGSTDIDKALSSIWDKIELVKNNEYFYNKSQSSFLNNLTKLEWGKGYLVKVNANCDLTWNVQ